MRLTLIVIINIAHIHLAKQFFCSCLINQCSNSKDIHAIKPQSREKKSENGKKYPLSS